jgi:hypothetical protein
LLRGVLEERLRVFYALKLASVKNPIINPPMNKAIIIKSAPWTGFNQKGMAYLRCHDMAI